LPSAESFDGKLRWAKKHLEAFRKEATAIADQRSHRVEVKDNPSTEEYIFTVHGLPTVNPDWGYLVGDCIHNLRSALDHLVLQLAILGQGGRQLTDREAFSCSFPIHTKPESFPDPSKSGPIKLLRAGERTRITELQPFSAWDPSIWGSTPHIPFGRMQPARIPSALARLQTLDNTDKHRTVHPTWRFVSWFAAAPPPIPLIGSSTFAGPLENETEVGRWHYHTPRPELPPDMDMNRHFPIGIALGEPPFMASAIELLGWQTAAVEIVLNLFRPCVERGDAPLPVSVIGE
jgi:hypothetical protein